MIWDLPHPTHTRFLESLSPVPHLENVLHGRYLGFIQNLRKSNKSIVRLILSSCSHDLTSQTGQNLDHLQLKYNKKSIGDLLRFSLRDRQVYPLEAEELWKVRMIEEVSLIKKDLLEIDFEEQFLDDILQDLCTL